MSLLLFFCFYYWTINPLRNIIYVFYDWKLKNAYQIFVEQMERWEKKCPKDSNLPELLFYSESHFYHDFLKLYYLYLFHKKTEYSLANLLCFYTVDDGVEHRRKKQVHIGHHWMDHFGGWSPIAMHQWQANHGDVENRHCSKVGDTGAKNFVSFLRGGNSENRVNDQDIRQDNAWCIYSCGQDEIN